MNPFKLFAVILISLSTASYSQTPKQIQSWKEQSKRVTIIRDNWGIPHIYGQSDTDAVFGLLYAMCEDNFAQIEETQISRLGRRSEIIGNAGFSNDMHAAITRVRSKAKNAYQTASPKVQAICRAAADGVNFYLQTHPSVQPLLFKKFEPWHFTLPEPVEPGIHGIARSELFAGGRGRNAEGEDQVLTMEDGSNAMAIAPKKSVSGKAMLLINPHQPFFTDYNRYECHMVSNEGLNAGGFAMLGMPFIWSGFNDNISWSHTNSGVDFSDIYLETFDHPSDSMQYRTGKEYKKAWMEVDSFLVKTKDGMRSHIVQVKMTHRGPVLGKRNGQLITERNSTGSIGKWIDQCWQIMHSGNLKQFIAAMKIRAFGYPTTTYADKFGNIAFWYANAVAKRDTAYDWRYPQQGSDENTAWKGLHAIHEVPHVINPATGWIQNSNSTPYLSAGASSPKRKNYPAYMSYEVQNFRAEEGVRLLSAPGKISFNDFQKIVTSSHLPMMHYWRPQIISAYENLSISQLTENKNLSDAISLLRNWDDHYGLQSKSTTLAVEWARNYSAYIIKTLPQNRVQSQILPYLSGHELPVTDSVAVGLLASAYDSLLSWYDTIPAWGDINRLQRIKVTGVAEVFSDARPSLPVAAVPGSMGSLFAFSSRRNNTLKNYGTGGNTYVALIEMGNRIRVRSINTFGQSADPSSPHYSDQAALYAAGKFKDVWFYRSDVEKNAVKKYHPGDL